MVFSARFKLYVQIHTKKIHLKIQYKRSLNPLVFKYISYEYIGMFTKSSLFKLGFQ